MKRHFLQPAVIILMILNKSYWIFGKVILISAHPLDILSFFKVSSIYTQGCWFSFANNQPLIDVASFFELEKSSEFRIGKWVHQFCLWELFGCSIKDCPWHSYNYSNYTNWCWLTQSFESRMLNINSTLESNNQSWRTWKRSSFILPFAHKHTHTINRLQNM